MTSLQMAILLILACLTLSTIGALAGLILYDTNSLTKVQPIALISTNATPISKGFNTRITYPTPLPTAFPTRVPTAVPTRVPTTPTSHPNSQENDCDSEEVNTWMEHSMPRIESIDSSLEAINTYHVNSYDEIIPYVEDAKQNYYAQLAQRTPTCLTEFQVIAVEELRLFWKGLEALSVSDIDAAEVYFSRLLEIKYAVDEVIEKIEQSK